MSWRSRSGSNKNSSSSQQSTSPVHQQAANAPATPVRNSSGMSAQGSPLRGSRDDGPAPSSTMSTTVSDVTSSPPTLDDKEDFENFPLCGTHAPIGRRDLEWLHGEVQFEETNVHGKYLIVPEGVRDAADVLAVMCTLWNLQVPELLLAIDGGQDTASGMLENVLEPDVWSPHSMEGRAAEANFGEALVKASRGIAMACGECKAWVYGFDGSYGSVDGDEMWGTCFNTAWSYFGQGRRSTSAGRKVEFICAKGLRGLFGERKFRKHAVKLAGTVETVVHYPMVSDRLQRDGKTVPDCVEVSDGGKMGRPERSQMIWPEFTHILLYDGDQLKYPFPDIYKTMKVLTSCVHVVLGGVHPTLTNSVVFESEHVPIVLLKHSGGAADIIVKALEQRSSNIGKRGASDSVKVTYKQSADYFLNSRPEWKKLMWSASHPITSVWSLPEPIKENNFVIVDVKKDGAMKIMDKFFRVCAYTDDQETRQLGAGMLERDQLQEAWQSVVFYKYNAGNFGLANSFFTYTIMALTLMTVVVAIIKILFERLYDEGYEPHLHVKPIPEWLTEWMFSDLTLEITVIVLPLMSGFFLSCVSRFVPYYKWCRLIHASNQIKTEIYRYRTRVGEYSRRQAPMLDINDRIRRMPSVRHEFLSKRNTQIGSTVASSRVSSGANTPRQLTEVDLSSIDFSSADLLKEPLIDDDRRRTRGSRGGRKSRRSAFQDRMETIHTELGNSDVRIASLSEPSRRYVRAERMSMVGARDSDFHTIEHFGEDFQHENLRDKVRGTSADDGFSTIVADDYVRFRLFPSISALSRVSRSHGTSTFWLETLRLFSTMVCTLCAVLQIYMLVPIMVAFIGLITNILEFHQFNTRLQSVNRALTQMQNLVIWWESLSLRKQRSRQVMEYLVEVTEDSMNADLLLARRTFKKPEMDQADEKPDERDKYGGSDSDDS